MKITKDPKLGELPRQIALYGDPKVGKTRTATSLPWGPIWGEQAIYMAWDPGSPALESVLHENRSHLIVVEPQPKLLSTGKTAYDPLEEACTMATHPWSKDFPEAKTLIWDTMTETSLQLVRAYANTGQFSERHITFGKAGTPSYHASAMEGDYGAAQNSTLFLLELLFQHQAHMNLVILFHTEVVEPKKGADPRLGGLYGGPGCAGKAAVRKISQRFNNLFRQYVGPSKSTDGKLVPKYMVQTQPSGNDIWLAGIRLPMEENPMPLVTLDSNPVNLWLTLDKHHAAKV